VHSISENKDVSEIIILYFFLWAENIVTNTASVPLVVYSHQEKNRDYTFPFAKKIN